MVNEKFREECDACGTEYGATDKDYLDLRHYRIGTSFTLEEDPSDPLWSSERHPCPKCGYNPKIEEKISNILNKAEFTLEDGVLAMNVNRLSDLIIETVRKNWPKPERTKPKKQTGVSSSP